jgi:tetratricopeptide (TPR) repeat protein
MPSPQKSVDLQPINSGARLKLIDTYSSTYYYQAALVHLDTLYRRKEINYAKLIMLATYSMHDGNYVKATNLLQEAATIYPFKMSEIDDLNGRLNLLADNPKQALSFYENFLAINPADYSTMYTIAKLYALTGNQSAAWKWLEKAVNNGFRYSWILKFDTVWDNYRVQSKWRTIEGRYAMKTYPPPVDSFLLNEQ